jgi:hypothetical protein
MSQGLMNLTLTGVNQTIEDVLDEYPAHPYQAAFSLPELRQKLVAHILSQMSNRLAAESAQDEPSAALGHHYSRLQIRLRMEMLVRGSILHILRENAAWLSRHLPNA